MWWCPIPRKHSAPDVLSWVIGSGGLIGSALSTELESTFDAPAIPWQDTQASKDSLRHALADFTTAASDQPWVIVWSAGAGTTVSGDNVFEREVEVFEDFISHLANSLPQGPGVMALISSAGGVHAGSESPPFTNATAPAPVSAYGRAKLTQEQIASRLLGGRVPLLICRVSNAYGPGQDLTKLQGLISRLAVATYKREPLHLFVPTSTVRDYIFTTDIARRVRLWLDNALAEQEREPQVVIIASGRGTSIAHLVKTASDVSHRRIPIAMGSHPSSSSQPKDSRFIPTPIPRTTDLSETSLPVGVKAVFDDISQRLAQARA